MKLIVKWINILDVSSGKAIKFSVQKVHTGQRHIISASKYYSRSEKVVYGRSDLESHADTTVAGASFCIFQYTVNIVMYHRIVTTMKISNAYQ